MSSNVNAAIRLKPYLAGLLNLSGLGLGYLYLERWRRWLVQFLITAALVLLAYATYLFEPPPVWLAVFGLWLLWMVIDGWRQGHRAAREPPKRRFTGWWYPAVLGVVLLAQVAGLWLYSVSGQQTFTAATAAYQTADCATALPLFSQVTTFYRLTLSANVHAASARSAECDVILSAQQAAQTGEYVKAVTTYEAYLSRYPNEPAAVPVITATVAAYTGWAGQLRQNGQYADAVQKYQIVAQKHPTATSEAQSSAAIAETYVQWADDRRKNGIYAQAIEKYDLAAKSSGGIPSPPLVTSISDTYAEWGMSLRVTKSFPDALDKYQVLLKDYPTTSAGQAAADQIPATYAEWAATLRANEKFQDALDKYQLILKEDSHTTVGEIAIQQIHTTYSEWADSLRAHGKFEDAIDRYQTLLKEYPDTTSGRTATARLATTYAEWANALRAGGYYPEAIEKYKTLLSKYPESVEGKAAPAATARVYAEWAAFLRRRGGDADFPNAINNYQILLNQYPETPAAQEAGQLLAATYSQWTDRLLRTFGDERVVDRLKQNGCSGEIGCKALTNAIARAYTALGEKLLGTQRYLKAMDVFTKLKELSDDADIVAAGEQNYNRALQELAQDTNTDGIRIMKEAVEDVQAGKPATSPAIAMSEDKPAKALGYNALPRDLKALTPGELRYVVSAKEGSTTLQTCKYLTTAGPRNLRRVQHSLVVSVRATRTGRVVNERAFYGSLPDKCSDTHIFYGSSDATEDGSWPSSDDVVAWLREVIR